MKIGHCLAAALEAHMVNTIGDMKNPLLHVKKKALTKKGNGNLKDATKHY